MSITKWKDIPMKLLSEIEEVWCFRGLGDCLNAIEAETKEVSFHRKRRCSGQRWMSSQQRQRRFIDTQGFGYLSE